MKAPIGFKAKCEMAFKLLIELNLVFLSITGGKILLSLHLLKWHIVGDQNFTVQTFAVGKKFLASTKCVPASKIFC